MFIIFWAIPTNEHLLFFQCSQHSSVQFAVSPHHQMQTGVSHSSLFDLITLADESYKFQLFCLFHAFGPCFWPMWPQEFMRHQGQWWERRKQTMTSTWKHVILWVLLTHMLGQNQHNMVSHFQHRFYFTIFVVRQCLFKEMLQWKTGEECLIVCIACEKIYIYCF